MYPVIVSVLVLVVALVAAYTWLRARVGPAPPAEPFEGEIYRVGAAAIAVRQPDSPQVSVVAMHGFLEDFRYFADHYDHPGVQFIGLLSGDYHLPVTRPRFRDASWQKTPTAPLGTIRYDAEVLCQALQHVASAPRVLVHGHSRGGAVVSEAAALRPDLFRDVEVVLEAPVLPGGRPYRALPTLVRWMLPFLMPLWRLKPINPTNLGAWGRLDIPRKRELIEALPFTPRRVSTIMLNLVDMDRWMKERSPDILESLARGVVLVPDTDRVLCPAAMEKSARRAPGLKTELVAGCSHFVRFDRPEYLPVPGEASSTDAGGRASAGNL